MKKILYIFVAMFLALTLTGCGEKNVKGSLEEIMEKVYASIPEDERPMMLMNTEVTEENVEMYLGTSDIEFEEALASESGVGSIAHSVVLIRMEEGTSQEEIDKAMKELKDKVNPRKWLCVGVEEVQVEIIRAQHDIANPNSGKVMQKCNMKYEGILRHAAVTSENKICDLVSYSIMKNEYK